MPRHFSKLRPLLQLICILGMLTGARTFAQTTPDPAGASQSRAQIVAFLKTQLPPAPDGFDWEFFKDATFLKPTGWNSVTDEVASTKNSVGMSVYAMSPEKFSKSQFFLTGFTIQIIRGSKASNGISAHQTALAYLKPFVEGRKKEDFLLFDRKAEGPYETYGLRYKDAPSGSTPIIVHKFLIVSDETDSVHIFTFESPASSWDENWKKFGTPILKRATVINHAVPD